MQSQTTLLSSIPECSVRDSSLAALLIVCIIIKWLYSGYEYVNNIFCTAVKVFYENDHRRYVHNLSSCEN